jgi:hypothetical protein
LTTEEAKLVSDASLALKNAVAPNAALQSTPPIADVVVSVDQLAKADDTQQAKNIVLEEPSHPPAGKKKAAKKTQPHKTSDVAKSEAKPSTKQLQDKWKNIKGVIK